MGRRVAANDWSATPLGPLETWPSGLRSAVTLVLHGGFPMILLWGPEHTVAAFNDAYLPLLGDKQDVLGRSFLDIWDEGEDCLVESEFRSGAASADLRYPMHRLGDLFFGRDMTAETVSVVREVRTLPEYLDAADGLPIAAGGYIAVPIIRNGRFSGRLAVYASAPRDWTTDETALVVEVAARAWSAVEQSVAEAAMRDSESRYRGLFEAIDEGFCVLEFRFDPSSGRADYRVTEANAGFYDNTGLPRAILGCWLREAAPALEEHWYEI